MLFAFALTMNPWNVPVVLQLATEQLSNKHENVAFVAKLKPVNVAANELITLQFCNTSWLEPFKFMPPKLLFMLDDMIRSRNTPTVTPKLMVLNALLLFPFRNNLQRVALISVEEETLNAVVPPVPQLIIEQLSTALLFICEKLMPPVTPEIESTFSRYKKLQPLMALIQRPLQLEIKLL
jgi:hypothetical protein